MVFELLKYYRGLSGFQEDGFHKALIEDGAGQIAYVPSENYFDKTEKSKLTAHQRLEKCLG